jgi:hypothetical protein
MTKVRKVLYILVIIGLSSTMVSGQFGGGNERPGWELFPGNGCNDPAGEC